MVSRKKYLVEYFIQIVALAISGGALLAAIFVETKYKKLNIASRANIDVATGTAGINQLYLKTEAVAGLIFVSTVGAVLVLVRRIFISRNPENNERIYSRLDLIFNLVCVLGYTTAGILGAFVTKDWFDVSNSPSLIVNVGSVKSLRDSVAASCGCSLFAAVLYGMVVPIIIIF